MLSRIVLVLAIGLSAITFRQAQACSYEARPLPVNIKAAKIAFVGSVRTVENGLATFSIEKGIAGVKAGETYDVDMLRDKSSCSERFAAGQRWLFLGKDMPSGSLLLQDEEGRIMTDNLAAVRKEVGDISDDGAEVQHGTIAASCAPWDGAAFAITLDNGVSASVYVDLSELDHKDKNSVASYSANDKSERGDASITLCPAPRKGKAENLPCQLQRGTISIGNVTGEEVTGNIETKDGEYHSLHVFHVKRLKKRALCG